MKSLGLGSVLVALLAGVLLWWASGRGEGRERREVAPAPAAAATKLEPSAPEASAAGSAASRAAVEPDTPTRAEPRTAVSAVARLFGTLTDADDGRPLVGLELGMRGVEGLVETRTAVDGSFAFELAPGAWTFFLRPPPGRVPFVQELELAPGEERELSRALGTAGGLCVRVWREELGQLVPCANAELWLIQGASDGLARASWPRLAALEPVLTDHEGRAELPFADFEKYVLALEHAGHLPYSAAFDFSPHLSWLPFSPDGCIHLALEEAGASVHGRVLDPDGRPLAGVLVATLGAEPSEGRPALSDALPPEAGEVWLQPSEFSTFATTASDGRFVLAPARRRTEQAAEVALIAVPGRAELVHHAVRPLSASELFGQSAIEFTLPRAGEVELEFVDESGAPRNGIASVRDADGLSHGGDGRFTWLDLDPRSAGRRLLTHDGRVRLRHPGGGVRIGLSPEGVWDEREFELELPPGEELRRLRVVVPR